MNEPFEGEVDIPGRGVDGPVFMVSGQRVYFTLAVMLDANRDDPEVCEWLRTAPIHAELPVGGGAAPLQIITRVA